MSKNLGTLTLDLVANTAGFVQGMDKAERNTAKWKKQVSRDLEAIKGAATVATAAISAATVALVTSSVKSASEISKLSQIAGTSFENFQRLAAGAQMAGIEQDKLGDILKDVSDKVGDFLQTGGGPMADFFENIAPKVGVTAEQFRNLSGPDALQLYVSSLEKANVSQNEMTFFMEAIASDATLLLPLLRDNGAGFRLLGDEAQRAGAIMSESTVSAADTLQATLFLVKQNSEGLKNQFASGLLPALADLGIALSDTGTETTIAAELAETLASAIKAITATAVGAYAAIKNFGEGIGATFAAASFAIRGEFGKAGEVLDSFGDDLEGEIERYGVMLSRIWDAGDSEAASKTEGRIQNIAKLLGEMREQAASAAPAVQSAITGQADTATPASAAPDEDVDKRLKALKAGFEARLNLMQKWHQREQEAEKAQQEELAKIQEDRQQVVRDNAEAISSDLTAITRGLAGEQSAAYRALFAVEKSFAIASSLVNIQSAIAKASNSAPWPASLAAMASVASATAGLVSNIMAVGMAHDGIDSIPKTGTWLLEKGERVVTQETSAKLDQTLSQISSRMQGQAPQASNIRIVNAIDEALVGDFMSSSAGERVILNTISRNGKAVRRLLA